MDFNYNSNILTITDEEGNITESLYDMKNRLIEQTVYNDEIGITTYNYYDGLGNQVLTIGPRGETTITKYNSLNQTITQILPEEDFVEYISGNRTELTLSPEINFHYNDAGYKVRDIKNAPGNETLITEYTVDELGRNTAVEQICDDVVLSRTETVYDNNNNVIQVTDDNGRHISYLYSERNMLLQETNMEGHITTYSYDLNNNVIGITDPRGNSGNYPDINFSVSYTYDNLNRLVIAILPPKTDTSGNVEISLEYDKTGNLLTLTNPDQSETTYTYTPRNWVDTETIIGDGKSYTISYEYDKVGNATVITDTRGQKTENIYDDLYRVIETIYPEKNNVQFEYDDAGNQTAYIDGLGNRSEYTYNLYNKLIESTITGEAETNKYYYDRFGNLTEDINALGQSRIYTYNRLNQLTEELTDIGTRYCFTYDALGNVLTSSDPNGTTGTYEYTDNYQLETLTLANGINTKTIQYLYDEAGSIKWVNDDGVETSYNGYAEGN